MVTMPVPVLPPARIAQPTVPPYAPTLTVSSINSTFRKDGDDNGKKQTFLTPGLIFGRFKRHGHLVIVFGAGFQIAATHFHTYNHAPIFTVRFPF